MPITLKDKMKELSPAQRKKVEAAPLQVDCRGNDLARAAAGAQAHPGKNGQAAQGHPGQYFAP